MTAVDEYRDGYAPSCADRRCDDCRAEDCVCACHLDPGYDPDDLTDMWEDTDAQ